MRLHLGDWWTRDRNGKTTAHRVGAVFPDLRVEPAGDLRPRPRDVLAGDRSRWVPLCECGIPAPDGARRDYAAALSTFMPWGDHERCSACEVLSPAFDAWLHDGQSRRNR
ncbi:MULTISPECIES: hypothetical protein [Mycobacteriaceae]|uniref:hypothetical protein n=1 Tax=Mycobacteriaceae TaxID=1762 RepID=UPI0002682469|nr:MULTISPECIES: hypothetical protein [Mycobacteriaceae]EIU74697.1 hypothetical protein MA6G1108_5321 [Mycobacteroides abscessus 6G-1108]EIV03139.1 hypothetical protein MA6G0728R_5443 [Mycobacteroides abscessus 6G-0728-R]